MGWGAYGPCSALSEISVYSQEWGSGKFRVLLTTGSWFCLGLWGLIYVRAQFSFPANEAGKWYLGMREWWLTLWLNITRLGVSRWRSTLDEACSLHSWLLNTDPGPMMGWIWVLQLETLKPAFIRDFYGSFGVTSLNAALSNTKHLVSFWVFPGTVNHFF